MNKAEISGIAPFFIVRSVPAALSFYRDRLGFDITFQEVNVVNSLPKGRNPHPLLIQLSRIFVVQWSSNHFKKTGESEKPNE